MEEAEVDINTLIKMEGMGAVVFMGANYGEIVANYLKNHRKSAANALQQTELADDSKRFYNFGLRKYNP